jgi:hypothetical protein
MKECELNQKERGKILLQKINPKQAIIFEPLQDHFLRFVS